MTNLSKFAIRMKTDRIFGKDGRAFVVAIDHPLTMPSPDLAKIGSVIENAREGGADAFLASYGCIRRFASSFDGAGLIMRADGGVTRLEKSAGALKMLWSAEDAVSIGADAMLCMGFPGSTLNAGTLVNVARTSAEAHSHGLLAGAEMLPYGFEHPEGVDTRTIEAVSFACRLGAEMGADFIKTEFVGGERFREVVSNCFVPVLVLGGSGAKSEDDILRDVEAAMAAGASGVIMGRNIARSSDISGLCRRIASIIHG